MVEPIKMPFGVWDVDSEGPKEPCITWGSKSPHMKGQFWGRKGTDPGHSQTCPTGYTESNSVGGSTGTVQVTMVQY